MRFGGLVLLEWPCLCLNCPQSDKSSHQVQFRARTMHRVEETVPRVSDRYRTRTQTAKALSAVLSTVLYNHCRLAKRPNSAKEFDQDH